MKTKLLLAAAIVFVGALAWPQPRIISFNSSGDLTWTNSVTNAVYRAQWASTPAGPWNSFSTQTNLNSIQARSNRVTVNVPIAPGDGPQFLRVGWTDAPPYAGLYDVREYDVDGKLLVTGSLWLAGERGSGSVKGTRNLYQVSGPPGYPGPQLGSGDIYGGFDASYAGLDVSLTPYYNDNNVDLEGSLVGNTYQGVWTWSTGGTSPLHQGWFTALKQNCDPPPPPGPVGTWAYGGMEASGSVVTGVLAFAMSTTITGTWLFANPVPPRPTVHLVGQGSFTNVSVSGNTLTIHIPAGDTAFELKGEMARGLYCGFFQWATNDVPMGFRQTGQFLAQRRTSP